MDIHTHARSHADATCYDAAHKRTYTKQNEPVVRTCFGFEVIWYSNTIPRILVPKGRTSFVSEINQVTWRLSQWFPRPPKWVLSYVSTPGANKGEMSTLTTINRTLSWDVIIPINAIRYMGR